ncbi:MarR family winged helix-turn-helix transcriptional regulator [Breznakia pachnodae]|uniref:DNA-binding MarR family transcriptional regulator n=1 Tax=Breznakia pachnodae TaxID=265178 RepID=A0ABU0E377_9FIRM|nr:MarR family winged helix-turn-helix transcriptional regulator [Breznakia pachnodae]MDQ0361352.1 DNA-binding MarR family transcriptional regulator [Breznakia pachnodae]
MIKTQKHGWKDLITGGQEMRVQLSKLMSRIAGTEDLSTNQMALIMGIYSGSLTSVGSVTKAFDIQQTNASTLCRKSEELGFIVRKRNNEDVRVVNLILTEKGEATVKSILKMLEQRYKHYQKEHGENIDFEMMEKGICEFVKLLNVIEGV